MFRVPFAEPESRLLISLEMRRSKCVEYGTRAFQISVILNTTRTGLKTIANNQRCGVRKESVLWRNQLIRELLSPWTVEKLNFTSKKPEDNELIAAASTGKERDVRLRSGPLARAEMPEGRVALLGRRYRLILFHAAT